MARKAMDSSASDGRKETSSKSRKEGQQCYLQRSSPGGIMLLELGFQVSFIQACSFIIILKEQLWP